MGFKNLNRGQKEIVRKTIHIFTCVIILIDLTFPQYTIPILILGIVLYSISEIFRISNLRIYYVHDLTEICARRNEEKSFIFPPLLLLSSFLILFLFFPKMSAYAGILVSNLADSFATLIGTNFGRNKIYKNKTFAGTLTFLLISFVSLIFFFDFSFLKSFLTSTIVTLIELISIKVDNLTAPLGIGVLTSAF